MENDTVYIFSDGGYQSNNGVGAYAVKFYNENNLSLFSRYDRVQGLDVPKDANFAEMLGLRYVLTVIRDSSVFYGKEIVICLDSMNCINIIKNYKKWLKNGWKTTNNKNVKHKQLIIQINTLFDEIMDQEKDVVFEHIKSHKEPPKDKNSEEFLIWEMNDLVDFLCYNEMIKKKDYDKYCKLNFWIISNMFCK